jgi:hypothetical protein
MRRKSRKTLLCTTVVAGACRGVAALIPSWIPISDFSYAECFNCSIVCFSPLSLCSDRRYRKE